MLLINDTGFSKWDFEKPNVLQSLFIAGFVMEVPEYYQNFLQAQTYLTSQRTETDLSIAWNNALNR